MRIDPFHLRDLTDEMDGFLVVEFRLEGMVRQQWKRRQQRSHDGNSGD
jgi:hypothetical protein